MIERRTMEVDIACVGFGPAMGGFLTTLSRALVDECGQPSLESCIMPGKPLQVVCCERADDIGFGVSGVVTRARSIRESFPDLDPSEIPMAADVCREKVLYLLDPVGAGRRTFGVKAMDGFFRALGRQNHACELPFIPPFLSKKDGLVLSTGQFSRWVRSQLPDLIRIWPGMPVGGPLIEGERVVGIRLADRGVNLDGSPAPGYAPGMDITAALTVVGDGPVGQVGQALDRHFGLPEGNHQTEWAIGMKAVVDLPADSNLPAGTVIHTLGYPEPEIFGFLYVYPERLASLGIFVPSWLDSPVRASYRYLQHWMTHPAIWDMLEGGTLRSWGAKSLRESGKRGEPFLAGNGYARIGESSGSTNMLSASGVDEAWATGVMLAEGVIGLLTAGKSFSRENLEAAYVDRRRTSWIEREAEAAKNARNGFQKGVFPGFAGMGLTGLSGGILNVGSRIRRPYERIPSLRDYCRGRISGEEVDKICLEAAARGESLADAVLDRLGWPQIPLDGRLLISRQEALARGKVGAQTGFADHVAMINPDLCCDCSPQLCVETCPGGAITASMGGGMPHFDREKCIHCGACLWNCTKPLEKNGEQCNIEFHAGSGGLHSTEN